MTDTFAIAPKDRSPWTWVPSLYFVQGIPYVMVMTVSVIMYKRLGVSNTDIALYTSWLYLPWVIKPLWSPVVDLLGTKRRWTVALQGVIGAVLALVAFSIPADRYFQYTIALFWLMAFCSATHDIAADGFYMLGLRQDQQAAYVGVRSTFYRIATIAAQGLLVMLAGYIETHSGLPPVRLEVGAVAGAEEATAGAEVAPAAAPDNGLALAAEPARLVIDLGDDAGEPQALVDEARRENILNGFTSDAAAEQAEKAASWWSQHISGPAGEFLTKRFGEERTAPAAFQGAGRLAAATLRLTQAPPAGESIVVLVGRKGGDDRIDVVEGTRLVFNASNWDKPAWVVFRTDPRLRASAAASFVASSGNIPLAWSTVAGVLAVMFALFCAYHHFALPRPPDDRPAKSGESHGFLAEFFRTFAIFFRRRDILTVLGFLLFFRFAEAQLVKLVSPFLLDPREIGGLGLTTGQVGLVYGTFGIAALMAGGILGGYLISRHGLRFWLWPMVLIMHSPDLIFVYLSYSQPDSLPVITAAVAIEQFGYGFGFTAYMLYMIMVAEGQHKTAHYAICTGIMALGMMVPGMFSGWLQDHIGYRHFFVWVVISTIPGFIVAALVRIDPRFGRRQAPAGEA
jgi:PAT family beta-lactamase induction signal transducer AmpG